MRRFLSILLASLMVLTMAVVLVFPTSAEEFQGDWVTSRDAEGYLEKNADSYKPAAGYHYTSEGFQTICPDYTDVDLRQDVHTRNKVYLKGDNDGQGNSVNLKFTVNGFPYGGDLNLDHWISICVTSGEHIGVPSTEYGEGLCILLRGYGDGAADVQPHYVDNQANFAGINGCFSRTSEIEVDEETGAETYTFKVRYEDGKYYFSVNEQEFTDPTLDALMERACGTDGAYVGIALHDGTTDVENCTITIKEWQGDLPTGDDSAQPEENVNEPYAEIADSSTVEANKPAVLWNSECIQHTDISFTGAADSINADGSVNMKASAQSSYLTFGVKRSFSYNAADFPVVAILTQNCNVDSANLYYCAGKVTTASGDYVESFDTGEYADVVYSEGWALSLVDLSIYTENEEDGWYGRINALRCDFSFSSGDSVLDDEYNNWNIAFVGAFRSADEAKAYTQAWLTEKGYGADEVTTEEPTTEAPTTEAPTTEAPTTDAPAGSDGETTTEGDDSTGGCKALVAMPVVALVAMLGVAFVAKKKD